MPSPEELPPASGSSAAALIELIDRQLLALSAAQEELDTYGFALASIHINQAIEQLRTERLELSIGQ